MIKFLKISAQFLSKSQDGQSNLERCRPAVNSHHNLFLADNSSSSKSLVLQVVNRSNRLWADLNSPTWAFLPSSSSRALLNSNFSLSKAFIVIINPEKWTECHRGEWLEVFEFMAVSL